MQSGSGERRAARAEAFAADGVEDDVLIGQDVGEPCLGVIDDVVGSQAAHEVDVGRAADTGDHRACVACDLHRVGPTPPAAPMTAILALTRAFAISCKACQAFKPATGTAAAST
jgi:hypothetical protein